MTSMLPTLPSFKLGGNSPIHLSSEDLRWIDAHNDCYPLEQNSLDKNRLQQISAYFKLSLDGQEALLFMHTMQWNNLPLDSDPSKLPWEAILHSISIHPLCTPLQAAHLAAA